MFKCRVCDEKNNDIFHIHSNREFFDWHKFVDDYLMRPEEGNKSWWITIE